MQRTRNYRRDMRQRAISRKKRILHHYTESYAEFDREGRVLLSDSSRRMPMEYYLCDGKYSKGKIHCGCGLCKPTKCFGYPSWQQERQEAARPFE